MCHHIKNRLFIISNLIIVLLISFLVYKQIFDKTYMSDINQHIIILYQYFYNPEYYIAHPLWHIMTYIISKLLFISIEYSAVITSSLFVWFWYVSVYLFSIVKYFEIYTSLHIIKRVILNALLLVQTIIGIYYLYHILIGQNPLYVSIWI
jgi:hypothetical protein